MNPRAPQRGIALPAMIFLLVVVGLMLSAGLLLLTQSQHSQSLQLQAARALAAAKSGADWGLWQVSDPDNLQALPGDALPPCFANQNLALPSPLNGLTVQVSCEREPASGTLDEGGLKLVSYRVRATASVGATTESDHVRREFEARATLCKNPGGQAPRFSC